MHKGKTVHVELPDRGYDILIGKGLRPLSLGDDPRTRVLLVSDSNVDPLYGPAWEAALRERGADVVRAVVPAGEESKSLACLESLYAQGVAAGLDRHSLVVALGGGVVGDLAGFFAATFLRGIRLIQAPTSVVAMVDSSVGGKTGINLPQGKNLVGAFHQPVEVVADLDALATLPDREYRSGLAEVVKYGVIWDGGWFSKIEKHVPQLLARDPAFLEEAVGRCCACKAEIVAIDERELGVRAILNFGHTLAHAIETAAGYGTWLHGEAVAAGMVFAAELSVALKGFAAEESARLRALLAALGLPVTPLALGPPLAWPALRQAMCADKKSRRSVPRFVLAERLGGVVFGCEVPEGVLDETYARLVKAGGSPCQR